MNIADMINSVAQFIKECMINAFCFFYHGGCAVNRPNRDGKSMFGDFPVHGVVCLPHKSACVDKGKNMDVVEEEKAQKELI